MPKVSDEYRAERRAEIAQAALQSIRRRGFARTTMADIIAEAGSSAGAIYSHFEGKADLARYIAGEIIGARVVALSRLREVGTDLRPSDVIEYMLDAIRAYDVPPEVLLQLWAEATVDPEIGEVIRETVEQIRPEFVAAIDA